MHGEEINQKIVKLDKRLVEHHISIGDIEWSQDKINEKFTETLKTVEKTKVLVEALKTDIEDVRERKLDTRIFEEQSAHLRNGLELLQKRVTHDEYEMNEFSQFMIRYMPLRFQNYVTSILGNCLDHRGLENLK